MNDKQYDLEIIAGPCSITPENAEEVIEVTSKITTPDGKRAIYGTRVVGLKSRTSLDREGEGMGIDSQAMQACMKLEDRSQCVLPSVELADKIARQTGLLIASEIMMPHLQLPVWAAKPGLRGNLMIWNPAVEQLGWHILEMSEFALSNNWHIGIKHGKFLGNDPLEVANHPDYEGETSLEKVLLGLTTYVHNPGGDLAIIHRGVDVPGRGEYRNALAHEIMKRIKPRVAGAKLYFDPTHSVGPKMKHKIIDEVIAAAHMKIGDEFLYDGFLIESASSSPVDFGEHLSINELKEVVNKLSTFRKLRAPKEPQQ